MNINIALNTIIYIMVFLFPGVLFRKFYYIGKHKHQFGHGNLFERFLITIILSIVCITTYTLFVENLVFNHFQLRLINRIKYLEFVDLFKSLSKNELPTLLENEQKFKDFSYLFILVYIFSIAFGFISYLIVAFTKIDRVFPFLRFINEWDYLFYAPSKELRKSKTAKIFSVNIDILTKTKEREVLYQGDLYKVLYNKDNDLESIAIRNAHRFVELDKTNEEDIKKIIDINESIRKRESRYLPYREYLNKKIFKRAINSDIFVINKSEIVNYNIVFLTKNGKLTNKINPFRIFIGITASFFILLIISLIALPFISIEKPEYFNGFLKRLLFSIYSIFQLFVIFGVMGNLKKSNKISQNINFVLIIALFGTFYLWFFDILHWGFTLLSAFGIIILMGLSNKLNKKAFSQLN